MWIVRLALARPYTFIVLAMVIFLLTSVVVPRTPTDIFPDINIPVIALVWNYYGLQPQEMEQRITSGVERGITTLVNDVEHIESQSLNGIAIIKVFFSREPIFRPLSRKPPPFHKLFFVPFRRVPRLLWSSSIPPPPFPFFRLA